MRKYYEKVVTLVIAITFLSFAHLAAQTVSGVVSDENGEPLPGASVLVVGSSQGTTTDFDGNYTITYNDGGQFTLQVMFMGYKSESRTFTGDATWNIQLTPDAALLEDVLVIGYGTVKKEDATGSVVAITSKDFNAGAVASPQDLVVGKTPGVQITSNGGEPGGGSTIRIRGGSSLSANNDPLFVIDGVPVDGVAGMRNPLSTIHPNDIETFTVLKDASATAIYGSRASNGVIIITTKRGAKGAPLQLNYSGNFSYGAIAKMVEVNDAAKFREIIEGTKGTGHPAYALLDAAGTDINTDWQSLIYRNTVSHDHNISATGSLLGSIPFRASAGFSDQQGILVTDGINRITGSIGLNPSLLDDHLNISFNAKGMKLSNVFGNRGAIGQAVRFDPTKPAMSSDAVYAKYGGYWTWTDDNGVFNPLAGVNPVAMLNQRTDDNNVYRWLGNLQFDYKFHWLPELRANLNLGYDWAETVGSVVEDKTLANTIRTENGIAVVGNDNKYYDKKKNTTLDFYLQYSNKVGIHDYDLQAGYSYQHFNTSGWNNNTAWDVANSKPLVLVSSGDRFGQRASEYFLLSYFGRFKYTLDNKYLITATLRNDYSSRFHPDNRSGIFPAVGLGWKINEEEFLKGSTVVSSLKLRLGWGITGQQDIGNNYPYMPRYTQSDLRAMYQFGNQFYYTWRPEGYDQNIKWEETVTTNIGIDFGFYNDRINGSIEYYQRQTNDLLNVIPVPAGTNLTNQIFTNVGNLTNNGIEFAVNFRPVVSEDTFWEIGFNLTANKNEITKLTASDEADYPGVAVGGISGGVGNTVQRHIVGSPAYSFYVYEQVYDSNGNPIEGLYVDRNNDGQIDEKDKYNFKDPAPKMFIGINSRFEHKNWDASFTGRISLGNYVYNNVNSDRSFYGNMVAGGYLNNSTTEINDSQFYNAQYWSDYYVQDASFFRLDNVSIGYTFDNVSLGKNSNLRLSLTGQNLLVISKYNGIDPEVFNGIDNNIYPRPRVFMFGASLNF